MSSTPQLAPIHQISGAVLRDVDRYREAFLEARPFKYLAIENFFEPAFAERLLAEFPSFNRDLARNETGGTGGKAVNTRIREISPTYQELYDTLGSAPFLDFVSRLSGIPDLVLDPKMFGGGTHDNQHGQELDPHVDFNYDEARQLHRRLNLIVYLNKDWKTEWGGAIEIHSNPRDPFTNQIQGFDPLFNRCVMFETNEYSWHGFPKINLPPDKRHLSRKSISIYLYTKDRPAEEVAPLHGTFYVQRFLPKHIVAGHTLTEEDFADLQRLLIRRDGWIEYYQKMELAKNRDVTQKEAAIADLLSHVRAPLTGYALQAGAPAGIYADDWVASHAELRIRPVVPVSGVIVRGWRPEGAPEARVRVSIDRTTSTEASIGGGAFEVTIKPPQPAQETFQVTVDVESAGNGLPPSGDARDLAFRLVELRMRHPIMGTITKMLN